MQDRSNKDVCSLFQSTICTHDPMWWNYVFTIEHTPEQMVNQHMANEIVNHQFACPTMHLEFHNL
jgi:CRISPR/Cas system endoribonuclease Cas6 (RAMP superfamily)